MERRYFLRISLMDISGACDILLNNEQAQALTAPRPVARRLVQLQEPVRSLEINLPCVSLQVWVL